MYGVRAIDLFFVSNENECATNKIVSRTKKTNKNFE